jgi:hypothetical protein
MTNDFFTATTVGFTETFNDVATLATEYVVTTELVPTVAEPLNAAVTRIVDPLASTDAEHKAFPLTTVATQEPVALDPEIAVNVTEPVAVGGVTEADQVASPSATTAVFGRVIVVTLTARWTVRLPVAFDASRRASPL